MGKKSKQGQARKDVFYRRAKEAGYRARAAYKLIQLDRKYNFLSSSRVCIDLCAAPGSWMQVASKFMPGSSVIIGVDRYPIHNIPNTLSIQGDITTVKVRSDLKNNLKTWKADLVLHDGAPNVGSNWLYDAYQQNLLVLHSFKLACEFLQKGGNFITKVFRSKDHLSLQYVFKKLFKRVEATKPIASRFESAEIFVVCLGYLCPDKTDPKFFDPHYVFQSLEAEPKNKINALQPEKVRRRADGYEEGITMLFKKNKISEFIKSSNFMDILEQTNQFEWDLEFARNSPHTTSEIMEFVKDIKVLNKKDIRAILNWRKSVKADIEEMAKEVKKKQEKDKVDMAETQDKDDDDDDIDEEMKELDQVQEQIASLKANKEREEKRHKKKVEKKKKKIEERMNLRLMVPGDPGPQEMSGDGLFALNSLTKVTSLNDIVDKAGDILAESDESDEESGPEFERYTRGGNGILDSTGTYYKKPEESDTDVDSGDESFSEDEGLNLKKEEEKDKKKLKKVTFADQPSDPEDSEEELNDSKINPLLTDLVGDNTVSRKERKAEKWFSSELFEDLEQEVIEDYEVESALKKKQVGGVDEEDGMDESSVHSEKFVAKDAPNSDSDIDSDSGLDSDNEKQDDSGETKKEKKSQVKLSALGLALGTRMIRSKKAMRDICDDGWNKYMTGDEQLPEWFEHDERKHNKPGVEVDREDLQMYQDREKAVDARSMKKVVEAKARKLRKAKKRLAKARKKATEITSNDDMTVREKASELQKIYKKATMTKPKETKYVVMKKAFLGKKPKGIKGPSRMVDKRMKKDKRANARKEQKKGGKTAKRKSKR